MSRCVSLKCEFTNEEKYGLLRGEYMCHTHQGYTINGWCPRLNEKYDLDTVEGLARVIDPWAFPTDKQIEILSVCQTGWPEDQRIMREDMKYVAARHKALTAAERLLKLEGKL